MENLNQEIDQDYRTLLHYAIVSQNLNIVDYVFTGLKEEDMELINKQDLTGKTALHYAAFKGNLELSKLLIKNGASVDAITKIGKNIIHLSSEGNQPSLMVYFLIKEKLDIYTRDENGSSPLHWACFSGAKDSIKFLIALKALCRQGYTPCSC